MGSVMSCLLLTGGRSRTNSLGGPLAPILKELGCLLYESVDPFEGKGQQLGDLAARSREYTDRDSDEHEDVILEKLLMLFIVF